MLRILCSVGVMAMILDVPAGHAVDFRDAIRAASSATVAVRLEGVQATETIAEQRSMRRGAIRGSARNPIDGWIRPQWDTTDRSLRAGFVVATDLIVTINVPPGTKDVEVLTGEQKKLSGQVVLRDHVTGLAAIRVDDGSLAPLPIGVEAPEPGLEVVISWLREGKHLTSDAAMIASRPISIAASLGLTQEVDADVTMAVAGAPVLDSSGVVVGVIAQPRPWEGLGGVVLCLPAAEVTRLIEAAGNPEPKDLQRGLVGIQFGANEVGIGVVKSLIDDSPAAEADIEPGDKIVGVNGYATHSHWDVVAAVAQARAGDEVKVILERDGATRETTVKLAAQGEQYVADRQPFDPTGRENFGLRDGRFVPLHEFNGEWSLEDFQKRFGNNPPQMDKALPFAQPKQFDRFQVERDTFEQALRNLEAAKKKQDDTIRELKEKIESLQFPAEKPLRGEIREQVTELIEEMQKRLDRGDDEEGDKE